MATGWRWLGIGVVGLAAFLLIAYAVLDWAPDRFAETANLGPKGRADARQGVRTAGLALLAGAIAVIGAIYTGRTYALNRAGQLTDRFTKAIEQLGHEEMDVRLGGIYALERIARDSKEDHPQVVEALTAFVREHAPHARRTEAPEPRRKREGVDTDVQAVLTVVGRRTRSREQLYLKDTCLVGGQFGNGNFAYVWFGDADLENADFRNTDLRNAHLEEANLAGAKFGLADLRERHASP
jgi:hypothetical protein